MEGNVVNFTIGMLEQSKNNGTWLNFARKQGNKAKILKGTQEPITPLPPETLTTENPKLNLVLWVDYL